MTTRPLLRHFAAVSRTLPMRFYATVPKPGTVPPIKNATAAPTPIIATASATTATATTPTASATATTTPTATATATSSGRPRQRKSTAFRWGLVAGLIVGITAGAYDNNLISLEDTETVQPPTKSEPFPKKMDIKGTPFEIVGVGVRTVSFLKIHVYAVGIYMASADRLKARTALVAAGADQKTLLDEKKSVEIVDALLAAGVRLAIRITPVRNTEFSHLRDGFVRSIMSNPASKESSDSASFGEGIAELKRAFGRKRKAPKDDSIFMVRTPTGGLDCIYSPKQGEIEDLGHVDDINVARVFFLQYLSGKSPNSPSARDSAVQGLLEVAN